MKMEAQTPPTNGLQQFRQLLDVNVVYSTKKPQTNFFESTPQLGFQDWEIGLTIVLAVTGLIAVSAVMVWAMSYKRKSNIRRQEFNERMSQYYDSISITGNNLPSYGDTRRHSNDSMCTVFTIMSTPISSRTGSLATSVHHPRSFSSLDTASTSLSPSVYHQGKQSDYKFSLEDTVKKLRELDCDNNISQMRTSYWSECELDISFSLSEEAEREIMEDDTEGCIGTQDLFSKAVLRIDNRLFSECSVL